MTLNRKSARQCAAAAGSVTRHASFEKNAPSAEEYSAHVSGNHNQAGKI